MILDDRMCENMSGNLSVSKPTVHNMNYSNDVCPCFPKQFPKIFSDTIIED